MRSSSQQEGPTDEDVEKALSLCCDALEAKQEAHALTDMTLSSFFFGSLPVIQCRLVPSVRESSSAPVTPSIKHAAGGTMIVNKSFGAPSSFMQPK